MRGWLLWRGIRLVLSILLLALAMSALGLAASPTAGATTIYLPTLTTSLPNYLALGSVTDVAGPTPCSDSTCYNMTVSCQSLRSDITARLKVGEPLIGPSKGTIVIASGYHGDLFWDAWGGESGRVVNELRSAGFRTVQIAWDNSNFWYNGAPSAYEGHQALACRPATVTRWIYDTFHTSMDDQALCGYGHSNGAGQIAYPLTRYGLADIYDAVLFDAGPNWARLDYACLNLPNNPHPELAYSSQERRETDLGFGFSGSGGPCARQDATHTSTLQEASVAFGRWNFALAETQVGFIRGERDNTFARKHSDYFETFLHGIARRPIHSQTIPNTGHITFASEAGGDAIRDYMLSYCRAP